MNVRPPTTAAILSLASMLASIAAGLAAGAAAGIGLVRLFQGWTAYRFINHDAAITTVCAGALAIGGGLIGFALHRAGLPLLVKELTELASRRRTYILRFIAAGLLFLFAMTAIADELRWRRDDPLAVIGAGGQMIDTLAVCLMVGIYLFLPATMCPAISHERERGTLELLTLTAMRPWQIVLQKYISRLVPVLSLILLAMPPMAVAYLYGGLEAGTVADLTYVLLLAAIQVGAITLMWSAFCRSAASAFIFSYATLALLYIGWPMLVFFGGGFRGGSEQVAFLFNAPIMLIAVIEPGAPFNMYTQSIGVWGTAAVALLLAYRWTITRVSIKGRNPLLALFRGLDTGFNRMNAVTGGIELIQRHRELPDDDPVAWSEMHRRAIGRPHYLLRIILAVEVPVLVIAMLIAINKNGASWRSQSEWLSVMLMLMWPAVALTLTVMAANTFSAERGGQTLDVLLTTPLTTAEILRQKLVAFRRFRAAAVIPLATVLAIEAWVEWKFGGHDPSTSLFIAYAVCSLTIYPWLITWVGVWIGMRTPTQTRGVLGAVLAVAGICIVPLIMSVVVMAMFGFDELGENLLAVSPVAVVVLAEFDELDEIARAEWLVLLLHFGFWGFAALFARMKVEIDADRLLGRLARATPGAAGPTVDTAAQEQRPEP